MVSLALNMPFLEFSLQNQDGNARAGLIQTPHASIETPIFMPVGTLATVKSQSPDELRSMGSHIILGNTYHLWIRPGAEVVQKMGGLRKFMNWDRAILTDSGGFQVYSLASLRKIDDDGVSFRSHLDGAPLRMTAEVSMQIQAQLGSSIAMAFDECPPADADRKTIERAMSRTTTWAKRSLAAPKLVPQARFGIVQGGTHLDLRREHLDAIASIHHDGAGFDGIALGGFSVGEPIPDMHRCLPEITPLMPKDKPRYLMGVGTPLDLLVGIESGIDMFDCVLPTRNARNGQALTWNGRVNLKQSRHKLDDAPLDRNCRCHTCTTYSRAYLHHLIRMNEMLGARAVTHHNLYFYLELTRRARVAIESKTFAAFKADTIATMASGDEIASPLASPKV